MPDESSAPAQENSATISAGLNSAAPGDSLPAAVRQVAFAGVLVIGFIVYLGTLQFGFVYDDTAQILKNPRVQSWQYLSQYFSGAVWAQLGGLDYYRPIFLVWLLLNHTFLGLSATGWHAALVLLHLAASAMAYLVARRLLHNDAAALSLTLLFAVHPAHVESVAWVSGAPDPLMAVFFFGSYWAFLRWREASGGSRWLALSLGLYALAELSKEPGMLLAALLLGHALLFPRDQDAAGSGWRRALKDISPFAVLAILYIFVRAAVLPAVAEHKVDLSWATVAMTWPWLLWFYAKKLFWAAPISAFYDAPYVDSPASPQFWVPLLLVGALAAVLFLWWRNTRDRLVPLAVLWIVIPVLPTLDLVAFAPHEYAHDRYLYISVFGFCLLLVRLLWQFPFSRYLRAWDPQRTRVAAVLIFAATFAGITVQQSVYWANNLLLYSRGVEIAPKTAVKAVNNLVPEMMRLGMYQEAMQKIQSVADQHPDDWGLQFNAASILLQLNHLPQAEAYLVKATRLAGDSKSVPWLYLGLARMREGLNAQAEEPLRRAVRISPEKPENRYALAIDLRQIGKSAEAVSLLEELVKEFPDQPGYRSQLDSARKASKADIRSAPAQEPE